VGNGAAQLISRVEKAIQHYLESSNFIVDGRNIPAGRGVFRLGG
jgi:hypothetical protein